MNIKNRIQSLLPGATILGMILFVGATVSAQTILQTVSQTGGGPSWNDAIWGTPAAVPHSGTNYETPSTFWVRTPGKNLTGLYNTNFFGDSLQIDAGGILQLKHGGTLTNAAIVNLILNGGTMNFHGGFAPVPVPVEGTIQVIADSVIATDQTGANAADIWVLSSISGTNNLTVNMLAPGANNVILFGTNTAFSGNWSNANGGLIVEGSTTNALGSGSVILQVADAFLGFKANNNLVVGNGIYGNGSVYKWNTNTVALNGTNTFTGSLIISNGVIQIGNGSAISTAATISLLNGSTLDASPAGGLTLDPAGQNLSCNGTVIGDLTASTADALNFHLSATTNDILNVTGSLTLNGTPYLNLLLTGYKAAGTYRLINYSGTIQGGGSFNLIPPAGSTETFQLDTSTPGQVNLIVTGTTYNTTWVGDGSANYWDTSSQNWSGSTNVYQAVGDNVTFNDSGSAVPDIYIVAPVTPNSMTVNNTSKQYIFDGSASTVGISTSGALTKMGTGELDFTSSGNNFSGPVTIQAGTLSIGVGGSFGYLGNPSSITNNGILQVNLGANGEAFNSPISGSGSLNITGGGATVTLGATNSYAGGTTIGNGCQLEISTSSALGSGSAVVLTGGRLGVNTLVGSMTVANPVVVSGNYMSPGGALYVNTSGNNVTWSGPITVGAGNDGIVNQIRAVNANVHMNFSNTVLGTNEILECTAGNIAGDATSVITFNNNISLGSSGSLLVDGLAVVVLAGNNNVWGGGTTVGLSGNSSYISSSTATLLVNGKLHGGALSVANLTTLGGSGIILDPVAVDGTLAPGNSGIGTLTVSNSVTFASDGAAVMEINRASAPNADQLSANTIVYGGTLTVNNLGGALQAGDTFHLFNGAISGTFAATNLPALSSTNMSWDTSLLNSGTIKVVGNTAPTPTITFPSVSGSNFTLQVASSANGFNYVLQATPALSTPITWTPISTNAGTGGTLIITNAITPGNPRQFFRISVQ